MNDSANMSVSPIQYLNRIVAESQEFAEMPLLQVIAKVSRWVKGSGMPSFLLENIKPAAASLGKRLGLTSMEAIMLSVFVNFYDKDSIELTDLCDYLSIGKMEIAQLQGVIDSLEHKRYIKRSDSVCATSYSYCVPRACMRALSDNKPFTRERRYNLTASMFVEEVASIIKERMNHQLPFSIMAQDLRNVVTDNSGLKTAQELDKLRDSLLDSNWSVIAALMANQYYNPESPTFLVASIKRFCAPGDYPKIRKELEEGTSDLLRLGYVRLVKDDEGKMAIALTAKGKKKFLGEIKNLESECEGESDDKTLKRPKDIATKEMHYNDGVRRQVDELLAMLKPSEFNEIFKRMRKNKMRRGFACLFYGPAGTGKTETVLQLAKRTGRSIMQVNIADIRDKYVGETEKNLKAVFDKYREAVQSEKRCPILLFNEADGLIGKRLDSPRNSVDMMENAMQNILLEELETFEGILIATTNLEGNLDSAFERRFIYKILFEKPSADVRKLIWRSHIPSLCEADALRLANEHDFSGGQIENIARKRMVDEVLHGAPADMYASIKAYCAAELIQSRNALPSVGFRA